MKKYAAFITILAILIAPVFAHAQDTLVTWKIDRVLEKTTKSGSPYQLFFVKEAKELNGVRYTKEVPVFNFTGQKLRPGIHKLIVDKSRRGDGFVVVAIVE